MHCRFVNGCVNAAVQSLKSGARDTYGPAQIPDMAPSFLANHHHLTSHE